MLKPGFRSCPCVHHFTACPPYLGAESEVEWEAESPAPDERLVYTMLTRPLPSYALEHFFAQHGPVDSVVLRADERYGVVRFRTPDAARAALDALHGTQAWRLPSFHCEVV